MKWVDDVKRRRERMELGHVAEVSVERLLVAECSSSSSSSSPCLV